MSAEQEIAEWQAAVERVCRLAETSDLEVRVPATPDWTARELLSHMVGYSADALAGDEPDDHNSDWTQAQVDARRGRSGAELAAEWRGLTEPMAAWMREHGTRPLSDAIIHEQDLRSALGAPGARDTAGFALVRERMAGRLDAPVRLVGETWSYGDPDAETRLHASDFDLGRALTARRTAEQLRAWTEAGDVTPHLDAFAGLGPLPDAPLPE